MLTETVPFTRIYIATGYTDLRAGIDGLAALVKQKFELDPFQAGTLFLFCGRRRDRFKGLVVELEDGSLANVEIQKRGYDFPGQRSACYSADLLLRQYKRVRSKKGDQFTYQDVKDTYCIVIFEHSPAELKDFHFR